MMLMLLLTMMMGNAVCEDKDDDDDDDDFNVCFCVPRDVSIVVVAVLLRGLQIPVKKLQRSVRT